MNKKLAQYKRLLALSQAGLYYGKDVFDKERFEEIRTISLELISEIGKETFEEIKALTTIGEGHPTPKVDVRAYIKKDGKVLLIEDKRTKEWSLPGGFAEIGLSPEENVRKEVYEETGLTVELLSCEQFLIRINKKIFHSFFSIINLFLLVRSTVKRPSLLRIMKLPTWDFLV